MTDDLPAGVQDYPGIGWPISQERELRDPGPTRLGNVDLWGAFHTSIFPTTDPPAWGLTLMYTVEEGSVILSMALAGGDELPDLLRKVSRLRALRWWQRRAIRAMVVDLAQHKAAMLTDAVVDGPSPAPYDVLTLSPAAIDRIPVGHRRGRITMQHLREVAEIYRQAWAAGGSPTRAVADHFERPHSTAADWVLRARKAGVLGPSDGTRGGEQR